MDNNSACYPTGRLNKQDALLYVLISFAESLDLIFWLCNPFSLKKLCPLGTSANINAIKTETPTKT